MTKKHNKLKERSVYIFVGTMHVDNKYRARSVKGKDYHELKQKHQSVLSKVTIDEAKV